MSIFQNSASLYLGSALNIDTIMIIGPRDN